MQSSYDVVGAMPVSVRLPDDVIGQLATVVGAGPVSAREPTGTVMPMPIVGVVVENAIDPDVPESPRICSTLLTLSSNAPVLRYNSSKKRHHLGVITPLESTTVSLIPGILTGIGVAGGMDLLAALPTIVPPSVCAVP